MSTLVKAANAGGLVAFIWVNISWMALPWHWSTIGGVTSESPIAEALKNNVSESGVYILPYSADHSQEAQVEVHKKMAEGPYAFMVVHPNGIDLSMSKMMVGGLLLHIIVALILSFLLSKTSGLSYSQQVGFVALAAMAGTLLVNVADWNWWNFPVTYILINLLDALITWVLAGMVIAKLVKPDMKVTFA